MAAWPNSGNNPELKTSKTHTNYIIKSCTDNQFSSLLEAVKNFGPASLPVNEQILGQPFCSDDFENDLVGFQSLEVYSTRQSRVQALGETLPYDQPLGQEGVAKVTLQGLKERERMGWPGTKNLKHIISKHFK